MAISYNPRTVTDGLVLCLDAGNTKGFDKFENLLTYSKDFSSGWSSSLTLTLNNAIAPDGTLTAAKIQRPINSFNSNISNNPTLSSNTNYCYSAFVKLASTPDSTYSVCSLSSSNGSISPVYASISYNFVTGTISSFGNLPAISGVIPYPNGWYRLYMVINTSSQTNASLEIRPLANNLVSDFYIWGAQLERGSSITDYYTTTGTAKTRGSTLIDLSGRGNTGTLTNGPTFNSSNGGSIVLDSVDDYIDCGLSSFQPTAITLCAWVKHTVSADGGIIVKGDVNEATEWGMSFGYSSPHYLLGRATTYFNQLAYPWTGSLLTGFHYVCYTMINNTSASLYVDGTLVSSTNTIGSIGLNAKNVLIGKWNNYSPLNGNIAQVKIYNRALTAAEVQQNFNATRGRYGI
jgi:hypothetical protein